ncbi:hypothetical protein FNYG_05946 [Fusarium nygamai]|uniref:Uncharacterized protein n=1 Tax=Gibberella nygamai TaxID=42673 RepID=A0A2K0WDJ0_GIBNY|nr:hypothetical protein FNYG_05946 [Fusarium nygamai]
MHFSKLVLSLFVLGAAASPLPTKSEPLGDLANKSTKREAANAEPLGDLANKSTKR